MISYDFFRDLINQAELFEKGQEGKQLNLNNFGLFLTQQANKKEAFTDSRFGELEIEAQKKALELENTIGRLLTYLSRYARFYIKKALENSPLQSPEEFTYLALLLTHEKLSKTDLINKNLQEKTTGTEVIRRLIANGLVNQVNDAVDKRSKLVSISEKGKGVLFAVFADMTAVSKIISGNLTLEEKQTLQTILLKLEKFHHPIYENKIVNSKDDIEKIVKGLG